MNPLITSSILLNIVEKKLLVEVAKKLKEIRAVKQKN
jgi:hypothetical protein